MWSLSLVGKVVKWNKICGVLRERERVVPFPFQVKSSYFSNSLFLSTSVIKKNYSSCPDFRSLQHGM